MVNPVASQSAAVIERAITSPFRSAAAKVILHHPPLTSVAGVLAAAPKAAPSIDRLTLTVLPVAAETWSDDRAMKKVKLASSVFFLTPALVIGRVVFKFQRRIVLIDAGQGSGSRRPYV